MRCTEPYTENLHAARMSVRWSEDTSFSEKVDILLVLLVEMVFTMSNQVTSLAQLFSHFQR